MKKTLHCIVFLGLMVNGLTKVTAQTTSPLKDSTQVLLAEDDQIGNFPKKAMAALKQLNISGYYRFVTNFRHLDEAYANQAANPNNIFVGDDSQIPQLMLNINGSVIKNTSFGTDLYMWTPMTGAGTIENVKGLNLGISLYGKYFSPVGDFSVQAGGINWYSLSPFTFQTNKGYDRYSIFERNPWDPNTKSLSDRYNRFYQAGGIDQDQRWGQQAFQGVIVEGKNLPNGFSGVFMYGKTQLNGGLSPLPNNSYGGMIRKDFGSNFISLNTFNNTTYTDSTQRYHVGFNIITSEFRLKYKSFLIKGEIGAGRAIDQDTSKGWGEAISLKVSTTIADRVPLELHFYRISPKVINNSGAFINTAIRQTDASNASSGTQPVLPAVASAMVPIGQLTNNRQGIDLNGQFNIGIVKTSIGYSASMELDNLSSSITYGHPINGLALSHFWRWDFPSNVGPYNNLSKIYRAVYETLPLKNLDPKTGLPTQRKYFNSIEINSKLKTSLLGRALYVYYLGQYSSGQQFVAPLTVFSEKALIRTYYHQLETYYVFTPSVIWCNYFGVERIIANYDTQTDAVSRRPKNQTGVSIATGLDIRLSKGAGLYLRQRWMNYKDSSFALDKYKGFETTAEIKIFF